MLSNPDISPQEHDHQSREAKRVTTIGAWLDAVLSAVKVIVGLLVGSAALVADGIHSLSDLITDGFVFAAIHYGRQGPDKDHHYGHGRIETLTTLLLGSVLIFVAGGIAWSSIERLFSGTQINAPGLAAIAITLAALISKEWIFRYTMKVARRVQSKLLEANAWHSRSDALSTAVVLVALIGAQFGLGWLDAVAAIIVGLLVGKVGWYLLWVSARNWWIPPCPPMPSNKCMRWPVRCPALIAFMICALASPLVGRWSTCTLWLAQKSACLKPMRLATKSAAACVTSSRHSPMLSSILTRKTTLARVTPAVCQACLCALKWKPR
jgi:Co/Zn/Cd efflux system component